MHPKCQSKNKDWARKPLCISNRGKAHAKQVLTYQLNYSNLLNGKQTVAQEGETQKWLEISMISQTDKHTTSSIRLIVQS